MSKKPKKLTYQQQKRRKKQRAKIKKGPTITINRIKRVLQPKVPDDIDLEKLAELYRLEGIRKGIQLVAMMPQQLIDAVVRGDMPTHVETIVLLKKIKEGIESGHREALDHLEKMQTDLESLVGYKPVGEDVLVQTDQFVRIITIPKKEGGGFCAELDTHHRGIGSTKSAALEDLAALIAEEPVENP